jgi:beta-N-acetylhexosaminidase
VRKVKLPPGPVVVDVLGPVLTDEDRERIRHPAAGAVILFARNYENPEQFAALTADVERQREPALPVCVDHEGGRVQRFKEGFIAIPPMRALGK